jgi:flagellar hook-associated protein 3 FlgL
MNTIYNNSTSAFFERSSQSMGSLRAQAETLQSQLSSGARLTRSSDDPVAASKLRVLSRAGILSQIDEVNANRASTDLALTDTALQTFADYITRVQELAIQASNGTMTDSQRLGIGAELEQLHGNLVALANTRDSAGHSLFGGETAGPAYTLDGSGNAVYAGTASAGQIELGDGQTVARGVTGPEFLNFTINGNPTDLLAVVKGLADTLQGGGGDPATAASAARDALNTALDTITTSQTIVGARLAWIDLTTDRRIDLGELRSTEQKEVGGADEAETITRLQQVLMALEASQASFAKLSSLSLFDVVR